MFDGITAGEVLQMERICRTCGQESSLTPIFKASKSDGRKVSDEMLELLVKLKLNIKRNDGLPQNLCNYCLKTFAVIGEFCKRCEDVQEAFALYLKSHDDKKSPKPKEKTTKISTNSQSTVLFELTTDSCAEIKQEDDEPMKIETKEEEEDCIIQENCASQSKDEPTYLDEDWKCEYFVIDEDSDSKYESDDDEDDDIEENIVEEVLENDMADSSQKAEENSTTKKRKRVAKKLHRARNEKCQFCKRKFAVVRRHIPVCPERSVEVCEYCFLHFKTPQLLQEHIEEIHPQRMPACHVCFCAFETYTKRSSHMRIFHNEKLYKCEPCNQTYRKKISLLRHNQRLHSDIINKECDICEKVLATKYLYDAHMKGHENLKRFKCKFCQQAFKEARQLLNHERNHTGERPYLCDVCGQSFKQDAALKMHLNDHGRLPSATKSYRKTGTFPCTICEKVLTNRAVYYAHMRKHKNLVYNCEKCSKTYKTKHSFRQHPCERSITVPNRKNERNITNLPFECAVCGKGFLTHISLDKHAQKHLEVRQYKCDECGDAFKRVEHLKGHIRRIHLKLKTHACPECGKKFAQKFEVTYHRRTHFDEKPYKCRFCPEAFKFHNTLRVHERNVHTEERPYTCFVCNKSYKLNQALHTHLLSHSFKEIKEKEHLLGEINQSDVLKIVMEKSKSKKNKLPVKQEENTLKSTEEEEIQVDEAVEIIEEPEITEEDVQFLENIAFEISY